MFTSNEKKLLKKWFLKKDISKSTQRTYKSVLKKYKRITDKTLDELIKEARAEKILDEDDQKLLEYYLLFKEKLQKDNLSRNTISLHLHILNSFYNAYKIPLPEIKIPSKSAGLPKNENRLITNDEIKTLLGVAGTRDTAIIYFAALTGARPKEIRSLLILDIIKSVSEKFPEVKTVEDLFKYEHKYKDVLFIFKLYPSKTHSRYSCFLPYEGLRPILIYLKKRFHGKNPNIYPDSINSPLFVSKFGKPLKRTSLVTDFRNLGYEAGFKKEEGSFAWWRLYAFRHRYISMGINKRRLRDFVMETTGHSFNDVSDNYLIVNSEDYQNMYLELYPHISIDSSKKDFPKTDEIKKIEKDNKELKSDIEFLKEKMKTLEATNQINNKIK